MAENAVAKKKIADVIFLGGRCFFAWQSGRMFSRVWRLMGFWGLPVCLPFEFTTLRRSRPWSYRIPVLACRGQQGRQECGRPPGFGHLGSIPECSSHWLHWALVSADSGRSSAI